MIRTPAWFRGRSREPCSQSGEEWAASSSRLLQMTFGIALVVSGVEHSDALIGVVPTWHRAVMTLLTISPTLCSTTCDRLVTTNPPFLIPSPFWPSPYPAPIKMLPECESVSVTRLFFLIPIDGRKEFTVAIPLPICMLLLPKKSLCCVRINKDLELLLFPTVFLIHAGGKWVKSQK